MPGTQPMISSASGKRSLVDDSSCREMRLPAWSHTAVHVYVDAPATMIHYAISVSSSSRLNSACGLIIIDLIIISL